MRQSIGTGKMTQPRRRRVPRIGERGRGHVVLATSCWLLLLTMMLGLSCGSESPRTDENRSSKAASNNKRLRFLEKQEQDSTSSSSRRRRRTAEEGKKVWNITLVFDDDPTSAPTVTGFNTSGAKDTLLINNFISRSGMSRCLLNLYAADADSDGSLDRDEYADFLKLESDGHIDRSFGYVGAVYVAIYYAVACNQCYDATQNDNCCLGDKGVVELPQPADGDEQDRGQWVLFLCSTVDEEIATDFGAMPTASPTSAAPTVSPAAGLPTAPVGEPTKAPTKSRPTDSPTPEPTRRTRVPVASPTDKPSNEPTPEPSDTPTSSPTDTPSEMPSAPPTPNPTPERSAAPTAAPVSAATASPSEEPTDAPSQQPTDAPVTAFPTAGPTTSPVAVVTTAPSGAPIVTTSAPSSATTINPNDTLCVQFFYSLKNTAGLSASDILNEVNNTLKTGLELATRNITIGILNSTFPSGRSRSVSDASTMGDVGYPLWSFSPDGDRRFLTTDSSNVVRAHEIVYRGLSSEFGNDRADRILESLFVALYSRRDDVSFGDSDRRNLPWNSKHRNQRLQSRRLVYYTDVLPPNVTDVVDDSFCTGQAGGSSSNSTSLTSGGDVRCAFVSTEVCVVLEEGDDPAAIEKAIDEGFRVAVLDGTFFDAIPPENVP